MLICADFNDCVYVMFEKRSAIAGLESNIEHACSESRQL